jgi:diacylglycerol kinase
LSKAMGSSARLWLALFAVLIVIFVLGGRHLL